MRLGTLQYFVLSLAVLNIGASSPKDEIQDLTESVQASAQKNIAQEVVAKDEAQRAADMHLALRNARWGTPTEVEENPDFYIFKFETPENERLLLGRRMVSVDKFSKVAKIGVER